MVPGSDLHRTGLRVKRKPFQVIITRDGDHFRRQQITSTIRRRDSNVQFNDLLIGYTTVLKDNTKGLRRVEECTTETTTEIFPSTHI